MTFEEYLKSWYCLTIELYNKLPEWMKVELLARYPGKNILKGEEL